MNGDVIATWLRRQGHRIVQTESSYWYDVAPWQFQAFPQHQTLSPTPAELRRLLWRHGARAVRYSAPMSFPRGGVSGSMVLCEPPVLDKLGAEARQQVETGLNDCKVEPVSFEWLAKEGWAANSADLDMHGHPAMNEAEWHQLCLAGQGISGLEAWAAKIDGTLAAVILVAREDAAFSVCLGCSHRRFNERHAYQALLFTVSRELLQRDGVERLFYGVPSRGAENGEEGFLLNLGFQPTLLRQCVDLHPLFRPFATWSSHRRILSRCHKQPANARLARLEEVLRLHLEGLEPITEQDWPQLHQKEQARLTPRPRVLAEGKGIVVTFATPFDVRALVELHAACFSKETHILVQLGRPFLRAAYRWFVNAPTTVVLVARRGDRILGLTTLADEPYNIPMLKACKGEFVKGCLKHPMAMFNPELLQRLVRSFFQKRVSPSAGVSEKMGQIAFTGVHPDFQGLGIGKVLKEASIKVCKERGMVAVSTGVRRLNPRARRLNEQAGFVEVPSRSTRRLIFLRLDLTDKTTPGLAPHPVSEIHPPPSHIVLITAYYWPVNAATTHLMKDLGEGLAAGGYLVTVLTNGPSHSKQPVEDHPLLKGRIHRAWNPFIRELGIFSKFCEYFWFMAYFFLRGLFVKKVDLIFVVSTPPLAGLPAAALARLKGAKLVYNLQDIFPDSAVVAGILPADGFIYRWLRKAEEVTYRVSDLVVSISHSFSTYVQTVVPGTAVETIPNWVDTDNIRPRVASEDPAITEFRRGGAFVVQYAGNIGFMQNLETLLLAAECLKGVSEIRFVFIGDGNAKQSLIALADELQISNCDFLPLQPLDRVPSVYNSCDLGVIPLKPGAAQIAVPSKTWNYMAAGRPVIGCVENDSSLAEVIHASRAGSVVAPNDPKDLARVILEYWKAPNRVREEGAQGRVYVEEYLSRKVAIGKFIRTFNDLLGRSPRNF